MQPVSTALIDPNNLFREGLKILFTDRGFQITKEASSLEAALPMLSAGGAPQLVLIDPEGMGEVAQVVGALKAQCPDARLVLLTTKLDASFMASAIQAGADGFLMKDISIEALAQSLCLVMMGEKVFPTHLAALLISGRVSSSSLEMPPGRKGLTEREVQIVQCLLNGDSNKMIANHLGITEATIKVHLKSLLRKINASNRTQAAIWALHNDFGKGVHGNSAVA